MYRLVLDYLWHRDRFNSIYSACTAKSAVRCWCCWPVLAVAVSSPTPVRFECTDCTGSQTFSVSSWRIFWNQIANITKLFLKHRSILNYKRHTCIGNDKNDPRSLLPTEHFWKASQRIRRFVKKLKTPLWFVGKRPFGRYMALSKKQF